MNWQNFRWSVAGLTIIITVGILFGSHFFWQQYTLTKPMQELAAGITGVKSAVWENQSQNEPIVKIAVILDSVENLQTTYQALNERIYKIVGHKKYQILIHDSRTPELERLYYSMQFNIQEAIFTGKFSTMADQIQAKAAAATASAQVFVDAKYVYLQLSNQSGNMYVVIPRQTETEVR